jgi:DNA-binding SARP family transcriptional activator/DNA-binding XRE family transcriptional regulator
VRAYRREAGLTQKELAEKARLSVAALQDIEQSRRRRPRPSSMAALADALGLDPEQTATMMAGRDLTSSQRPQQSGPTGPAGPMGTGQGLWLAVLGPLEGWRDGAPLSFGPPARRAVLGLLLMDPDVGVRRDTIIDVLWGGQPPRTAVGLVQAHVSRLRKVLEPRRYSVGGGVLDSVPGAYRLRLSSAELDLLLFRDLAARAVSMRERGDDMAACELYENAVGLWRGDPLADVEGLSGHPGIVLLRQQLTTVLLQYAELACALGQHYRVLPQLLALAAAEPLNESVHARLMITLAGAGRQAAAIRVYEDLRSRLDRELGLHPGAELTEAHLRVLRQETCAVSHKRADTTGGARAVSEVIPRQLPAVTRHFTGRVRELNAMTGLLERNPADKSGLTILALTGMAGIGKTALAIYWTHQVADRFPDGQLFVNLQGFSPLSEPLVPTEAISGFLTALGVPYARIPVDAPGQIALFRSLLAGRRMLIVLDNARDAEQVRSLLPGSPGSPGCLVLVTSRNRLTGLTAAKGAHLLPLDCLTEQESRELLTRSLGPRAVAERGAAAELIGLCAGLPLALCGVIARTAASPNLPLAALAAELRDERGRLDALETGEAATSVRVVLSWSRARLTEIAAQMFRLLGIHMGVDITVPAAASLAGLSRSQAQLALAELCDGHLVTEYVPHRYMCHDLLRAYAAEAARIRDSDAEQREAIHRVLDHYMHTANAASAMLYPHYIPFPYAQPRPGVRPEEIEDSGQAAEWFENEQHVLLAAITRAAEDAYAPHAWDLPWAAGPFFATAVNWQELIVAQESALAVASDVGDTAGQALACHHIGALKFLHGEQDDARDYLDMARKLAIMLDDERLRALGDLTSTRFPRF